MSYGKTALFPKGKAKRSESKPRGKIFVRCIFDLMKLIKRGEKIRNRNVNVYCIYTFSGAKKVEKTGKEWYNM